VNRLQNYQYRTDLSWWIFAATGVCALVIPLLTVSFDGDKSSNSKPGEEFENGMNIWCLMSDFEIFLNQTSEIIHQKFFLNRTTE